MDAQFTLGEGKVPQELVMPEDVLYPGGMVLSWSEERQRSGVLAAAASS